MKRWFSVSDKNTLSLKCIGCLFLDSMWFQGSKACFRKLGIFTWEITHPKDLMHLENLSSNICRHMYIARRKRVLFCLACTYAWTTAKGDVCGMNYGLDDGSRNYWVARQSSFMVWCYINSTSYYCSGEIWQLELPWKSVKSKFYLWIAKRSLQMLKT